MHRFFVCRAYFKWKGKMYYKGDLLPVAFTHHDRARSIYGSRIGECEVEQPAEDDVEDPVSAGLNPTEHTPITTPLSGGAVIEVPEVEEQEKILDVEIPEVAEVPEIFEVAEVLEVPKVSVTPVRPPVPRAVADKPAQRGTKAAAPKPHSNTTPGTSR